MRVWRLENFYVFVCMSVVLLLTFREIGAFSCSAGPALSYRLERSSDRISNRALLVTMLRHIDDNRFLPAEQEISNSSAQNDHHAEPDIVCHKYQHEQERERHLEHVQQRLVQMVDGQHCRSV